MIEAHQYRWSAPLLDRYNRHLLRKSFATVRVAGLERLRQLAAPAILAPNHTCWWDGCVDLFLARQVVGIPTLLMMGETELSKHKAFSSLGVFGVDDRGGSTRESIRYLLRQIDASRNRPLAIWIYPEGAMQPSRAPIHVKEGAVFFAEKGGIPIIPVAHRYEFLMDDHPEVLIRIGEPLFDASREHDGSPRLAAEMTINLEHLDRDIVACQLGSYEIVLHGAESRNKRLERLRR